MASHDYPPPPSIEDLIRLARAQTLAQKPLPTNADVLVRMLDELRTAIDRYARLRARLERLAETVKNEAEYPAAPRVFKAACGELEAMIESTSIMPLSRPWLVRMTPPELEAAYRSDPDADLYPEFMAIFARDMEMACERLKDQVMAAIEPAKPTPNKQSRNQVRNDEIRQQLGEGATRKEMAGKYRLTSHTIGRIERNEL